MARGRGPIHAPSPTREDIAAAFAGPEIDTSEPDDVVLPPPDIIEAGVKKFQELANLHWPSGKDGYQSISFDSRNLHMLRITIGLVYMAMNDRARDPTRLAQLTGEPTDEASRA